MKETIQPQRQTSESFLAEGWNLNALIQTHLGYAPSRILASAIDFSVFDRIAAGNHTAREIAEAAGASERGMRMLLDALVGMQILDKSAQKYMLTPVAAQHLLRDSPDYLGDLLNLDRLWESWGRLTETIRTGKPFSPVEHQKQAEEFFPKLIRGLHVMNREPARRIAEILGAGKKHSGLRVLDVACGSGVWSIAIAEADSRARVTAQDFPGVLGTTAEFVKRHGLTNRYEYLPGDLKQVDFGKERFDLALLGNIVHTEGERSSRDLFRRIHEALHPGGKMVVIDMIPNDERTGPPFPLVFALNMLVNSEYGDTYTIAEFGDWVKTAGFSRMEAADIDFHSPILIAHK